MQRAAGGQACWTSSRDPPLALAFAGGMWTGFFRVVRAIAHHYEIGLAIRDVVSRKLITRVEKTSILTRNPLAQVEESQEYRNRCGLIYCTVSTKILRMGFEKSGQSEPDWVTFDRRAERKRAATLRTLEFVVNIAGTIEAGVSTPWAPGLEPWQENTLVEQKRPRLSSCQALRRR